MELELERADSAILVRGHEHERRRVGELVEHARELEPVDLGHPHVEEDRVETVVGKRAQCLAAAVGDRHLG